MTTDTQKPDRAWAKLYAAGVSSRDIAAQYGVSYMTVLRSVNATGVPKPSTKARNDEIRRAVADGESQSRVAKRYGLSRQRVHQIVHSSGVSHDDRTDDESRAGRG